jgi:hypothetical protein
MNLGCIIGLIASIGAGALILFLARISNNIYSWQGPAPWMGDLLKRRREQAAVKQQRRRERQSRLVLLTEQKEHRVLSASSKDSRQPKIIRRDKRLRKEIIALYPTNENNLKKRFIQQIATVDHYYLCAHEWEPVPGKPESGRGDIVCTGHDQETAWVVEVKFIGTTNKAKRWNKVVKQARYYSQMYKELHPHLRVIPTIFTEDGWSPVHTS